jgi:glycosyltransferase involved in cell wall biosynthesis
MDVKVSVIIPVYNAEKYLDKCLKSVVEQTLREIEIICVDDGSTDESLSILHGYEKADDRIRIITQENAGAGAARNRGMLEAKGEYLSFLDADDFFEPDMLFLAYAKANEEKAQVLVFGSDRYREDEDEFKEVSWTIRRQALPPYRPMNYLTFTDNVFKVFVGWAWDKIFERKFVKEQGLLFQEQRTSNDLLFVFTAIVAAERIEVIDKVLAHQRRDNPDSLSNTRERSWQCFYEALLALRKSLKKRGFYDELEQDFINYALHFSLWNLNTIRGEKKKSLYKMLKKTGFRELGIKGRPKKFFYNKSEYEEYKNIMKTSWRNYEKV